MKETRVEWSKRTQREEWFAAAKERILADAGKRTSQYRPPLVRSENLSQRERDAVAFLSVELKITRKNIAEAFGISIGAVQEHASAYLAAKRSRIRLERMAAK